MIDLSDMAQLPAINRTIERCLVDTVPAGAAPKDVTIQLPDGDGAKVPARYTGFPPGLAAGNSVVVRTTPQDTIKYVILGASGATAAISSSWPFDNIRSVDPANAFADDANLPDAVTNATAGDVVILNPGTYTLAAILDIDKSLTIDGVDPTRVTIQYSGADHTIDINAADVTLKNLTIINTSATANTAPVLAEGTDFVIENCILTSSGHAASNGVYSLGSSGKIVDSIVTASGASSVGIKDASATFTVSVVHCTVTGVNADISLSVAGSSVDIQDSTMTNGEINTISTSTLTGTLNGTILVNNSSGGIPAKGNVGYLDEAGDYKETTTEGDNVAWCVVEIGNVDGKNIFVRRRGETTVNVTTSPSAGHFLITSTTAGSATHSETMRPEIFAVCTAGESGGTVAVQLLTGTFFVAATTTVDIWRVDSASDSDFVALINSGGVGGLTATNVPYDTITAGAENVIKPQSSSQIGKMVLHNLGPGDPGTSRLISSVDTVNNAITTISSTDSWANNDSITIESQTSTSGTTQKSIDIDLSLASAIPLLSRTLAVEGFKKDTGAIGNWLIISPFTAFSAFKESAVYNWQAGTTFNPGYKVIELIDRHLCVRFKASGVGTASQILRLRGYELAIP